MSLASVGDLSNVDITLPDMLNINTDCCDGKDKTGKDAVVFHYGKVNQTSGNTVFYFSYLILITSLYLPSLLGNSKESNYLQTHL